ncbi:GNAT family N-acetyltransferase [Pseudoalteromonas sp. SCSIO 43201]|uniref:GNAT family N-acetyltransferase n=1 Tax=Pseudoalteromonas sp. SCSIO 43201 TaxID=2822842 RepID=UPI002075CC89|nr:GNAT family N-acetyltransferase [Pseudoalteromonas sp. SCSIO 43201]USD28932.1 GNAT family N-acetyltransferase [Pseudoalteromonas sp. SCSIO 43201]
MSINIKVASLEDNAQVANLFDLYRQFYKQDSDLDGAASFIYQRLMKKDSTIFLATSEESELGFLQVYPTFSSISMANVWLINDLYVCSRARGQGVAKQLLQQCVEQAEQLQVKLIRISTEFSNTAAAQLYEQFGFEKDTRFQHYNYFLKG